MWIDFCTTEVDPSALHFLITDVFGVPRDPKVEAESVEKITNAFEGLERWLETRTFLVGERITIADIAIAFSIEMVLRHATHAEALKKHKSVWRHYQTVLNQPKTLEVLRAFKAEIGIAPAAKPVAEAKPKEEKPAAKKEEKKPAKDEEEDEDAPMEDKKKPNPLDLLPASKWVLDDFKRAYSNKDIRKEVMPEFLANFDQDGWTAWWCKYKYNNELTKQFMSANLTRGWFQRMEGCRKYTFGIALLVGEENNHEIQAFWIIRGKPPLPECVMDVEDTALFEWTPIADVKTQAKEIEDFFMWEGPSFKRPVMEGRAFK